MNKLKTYLLSAMVMLSASAWAQKYHDAASFQLNGNPKEVKVNEDGKITTMTFDADGKAHAEGLSNPVYNTNGYMTSCDMSLKGVQGKRTMVYNAKGQLSRMTIDISGTPMTTDFTFNADGTVKEATTSVKIPMLNMTKKTKMTFTYEAVDSHGNWTKRTGKVMGKKTKQTRTITYW